MVLQVCGLQRKPSSTKLTPLTETLIAAIHRRGPEALNSLTAVSNNAGIEGKGGLAVLTKAGQVNRLILSFLGNNKALEKKYLTGELAVELCPQGTLAERIRAGGAGIPAFYTPTAARKLLSPHVSVSGLTSEKTPWYRRARSQYDSIHQGRSLRMAERGRPGNSMVEHFSWRLP